MTSMLQTTALPTQHADLVTDIAYDFYGERLATASADQRIKVWRKDVKKGNWELEDEWKAHEAPIHRISWSHPEFGSLIASCSYDRSVRIWEETDLLSSINLSGGGLPTAGGPGPGNASAGSGSGKIGNARWLERGFLSDAKGSVRGVEWAPNAFGVKLATISTDSYLRIYTSLSPSLNDWQLTNSIYLPTLSLSSASSALNAAGSSASFPAEIPPAGSSAGSSSSSLGAQGGSSLGQGPAGQVGQQGYNPGKGNEALGGWGLSWCKEKWWGQVVATTSGHAGVVKVINLSATVPTAILILEPPTNRTPPAASASAFNTAARSTAGEGPGSQAITSLSWAPTCGRSYHLIATGSRDGTVRVWKVWSPEPEEGSTEWKAEVMGEWGTGEATVGRVEWNVTGSILSVSSEDGQVRLFKATFAGKWACMGTFTAEAPNAMAEDDAGRMQE